MTPTNEGPVRVALTALGCKVNYAEMADLAGELAALGCDVVPDDEPADVRVLNSCTVTAQADATTRRRLRRLRRRDPDCHLILTGCSVDANPDLYKADAGGADAVVTNAGKRTIAAHIATRIAPGQTRSEAGGTLPLRSRAFLKVQDGCDHRCTYCIVWRARGASVSVPAETVVEHARAALAGGHRELVLTGVDLGGYGRGSSTDLASLVRRLLEVVGDQARVRLSSINANDVSAELIALNGDPRLCSHWHLPLQSGSDRVLRAMHRGYRRRQYLRVAEQLREAAADTEFTTDILVGFPGESEADHTDTLALVDEVGFLGCHVFRYSARQDTPAANLDSVDNGVCRRRSVEVRRAADRTAGARRLDAVGRLHDVVWDRVEVGAAQGVTATYHQVIAAPDAFTHRGGRQSVRAVAVEDDRLRATLCDS